MKKRVFTIITLALVLICLIFFIVKVMPRDDSYEGILVKEESFGGWQQI